MKMPVAVMIAVVVCCAPLYVEAKVDWDPEHTWVFAVGVLEWQHSDIWPSFPEDKKDRRDAQFAKFFHDAGVPNDQIVYLQDAAAKKAHIEKKFAALLDETDTGDLLIFYFSGHGYRDEETGQTWFANYDAGKKDSSAWNVRSIFGTIENRFSGKRVLMLADCCHSGALYDEAVKRHASHIAYATLTSAYSHNSSTGNWTFSDALLAGLRGQALVDADGDGMIELHEIARYAELDMAFIEGQKSMFVAADKFPREAKLAPAHGAVKTGVGDRIEVFSEGAWYKAKVIDAAGQQSKVHYVDFDNSWDEWVASNRIRPYRPPEFAVGAKVEAYAAEDEAWYPATVMKAWYGLHFIRYDDYDASWDEWVGSDAIRRRKQ